MYMGVILSGIRSNVSLTCAPHVYGGDPIQVGQLNNIMEVLPMYMGVIPERSGSGF